MDNSNDFLKQFGGSATANVMTVIVFMVYKFIEGRCKHSRCSSNTSCFRCSADNYATERGGSSEPRVKDDIQPKKSMFELPSRNRPEIQARYSSVIPVNQAESTDTASERQLALGNELV